MSAPKNKGGRPQIQIDEKQFKNLCGLFCTLTEVAWWFKCSEDTIERWCKRTYKAGFADILKRESSGRKMSLRRKQFEVAEKGNVALLIFLGKQYLGQSDKVIYDEGDLHHRPSENFKDEAS